jgi:hypothetical protein
MLLSNEEKKQRQREASLRWLNKPGNRERARASFSGWYRKNIKTTKQRWKKYQITRIELMRWYRARLIMAAGGACICCGFSDPRALQFDHINGDGFADRKTSKKIANICTEERYIEALERLGSELQLLCANCNWIKRVENKEYTTRNHLLPQKVLS